MRRIPVNERLPTKDQEGKLILVWINHSPHLAEVPQPGQFLTMQNKIYFFLDTQKWMKDAYYGEVTHWMPLPE
jgi:hypothetical protein